MSQARKHKVTRAVRYLRGAMLLTALTLPLLTLALFGSVWLWQNGLVLHWAASALAVTAIVFGVERWLLRDAFSQAQDATAPEDEPIRFPSDRENAAWRSVLNLAETTDADAIDSRDALIDLGERTVETVARQIHPEHKDPLLKFTLPELLALIERVSAELGPFVRETIPLGDRLTVGQFLAIYRWRGLLDVADKAYDIWRIIRIMNPATAVAQELREKFTRQLYDWGRKELARRLTTAYVREVGRGAIDLYSGRLRDQRPAPAQQNSVIASTPAGDTRIDPLTHAEPVPRQTKPWRFSGARRILAQASNAARLLFRRQRDDTIR